MITFVIVAISRFSFVYRGTLASLYFSSASSLCQVISKATPKRGLRAQKAKVGKERERATMRERGRESKRDEDNKGKEKMVEKKEIGRLVRSSEED